MAIGDAPAIELAKAVGGSDVSVDGTRSFHTSESEAAVRSIEK